MKFCTTCGRTYEDPEIDICPHDGTPLFGMAGSEGKDLPDEDVEPGGEEEGAELAASSQSVEELPVAAPAMEAGEEESGEDDLELSVPAAASAEPVAADDETSDGTDDDLFAEPSEPLFQESEAEQEAETSLRDELFGGEEDEEDEEVPSISTPPVVADDSVEDPLAASERALYGDEEEQPSLLSDDSEATPDTAPVLSDELFAEEREREFDIPGADDAASIQISEALDTTLEDLSDPSEPEGDVSLADAYQPTSIPQEEDPTADRMPDPLQEESSGGRTGLLLVLLVLILIAGAAWYFLAGPGATPEEPAQQPAVEQTDANAKEDGAQTPPVATSPDAGAGDAGAAQGDMGVAQADAASDSDTAGGEEPVRKDASSKGIAPPPVKKEEVKKAPAPVKKTAPKKATTPEPKKKVEEPKKTTTTTPPPAKKEEEPAKKEELNDELENLLE